MANITNSMSKNGNELVCHFTAYEEYPLYAVERQNVLYYTIYLLLILSNSVMAVVANVGNALILVAVWKTTSLQTPTNILLSGLAVSDLGVGLITQPAFVVRLVNSFTPSFYVWCSALFTVALTSYLLIAISFFTITALTVERLLALKLHLRFEELVTNTRVVIVLIIIWLLGIGTQILRTRVPTVVFGYFLVSCIVVLTTVNIWCYWKIFQVVRHHQVQIHVQQQPSGSRNQAFLTFNRYKKTVFTMLYIHGFFVLCYIPLSFAFLFLRLNEAMTPLFFLLVDICSSVLFFNSSLNPFVYCWRVSEMRRVINDFLPIFA